MPWRAPAIVFVFRFFIFFLVFSLYVIFLIFFLCFHYFVFCFSSCLVVLFVRSFFFWRFCGCLCWPSVMGVSHRSVWMYSGRGGGRVRDCVLVVFCTVCAVHVRLLLSFLVSLFFFSFSFLFCEQGAGSRTRDTKYIYTRAITPHGNTGTEKKREKRGINTHTKNIRVRGITF